MDRSAVLTTKIRTAFAPRSLGAWPTLLEPQPPLARALGLEALWLTREDLAGGNKVRGLEFLFANVAPRSRCSSSRRPKRPAPSARRSWRKRTWSCARRASQRCRGPCSAPGLRRVVLAKGRHTGFQAVAPTPARCSDIVSRRSSSAHSSRRHPTPSLYHSAPAVQPPGSRSASLRSAGRHE